MRNKIKIHRRTVSEAQKRQRILYTLKGKFAATEAICKNLMWDVNLTPTLRDKAHEAYLHLSEASKIFNKEVGWTITDKEDI